MLNESNSEMTEQGKMLFQRYEDAAETRPRLRELRTKLLNVGGREIVCPLDNNDLDSVLDNVLDRGMRWKGWRVRMLKGEPNQCHLNSALTWLHNRARMRVAVGFALSPDGLWRLHYWCVSSDGRKVYETTVRRDTYYGFVMTERECQEFFESFLPPELSGFCGDGGLSVECLETALAGL